MLIAVLGRLRERVLGASTDTLGEQPDLATMARDAWTRTSDPQLGPEFRLFFAVYGRPLQAPQQFEGFLERVVADWMDILRDAQGPISTKPRLRAGRRWWSRPFAGCCSTCWRPATETGYRTQPRASLRPSNKERYARAPTRPPIISDEAGQPRHLDRPRSGELGVLDGASPSDQGRFAQPRIRSELLNNEIRDIGSRDRPAMYA